MSQATSLPSEPRYGLGHSRAEIDRLDRQHEMLRPITERALASANIGAARRILDVGCGSGALLADLQCRLGTPGFPREGARLVGIDASAAAVEVARRRLGASVEVVQAPLEVYAPGERFDVLIARCVASHVLDHERFVQAATRLVRSGGRLVVIDPVVSAGYRVFPAHPAVDRFRSAVVELIRSSGRDPETGARLPGLLGTIDPHVRFFGEGIWLRPPSTMFADLLHVRAADYVAAGLYSAAEIDQAVAELRRIGEDPAYTGLYLHCVAAVAQVG